MFPTALRNRPDTGILVVIGIAAGTLALVHSGGTLAMWTALALRPLIHGVSTFKVDLLMLFVVVCGMLTLTGAGNTSPRQLRFYRRMTASALTVGGVTGLAGFLDTSLRLGLPLNKHVYFFRDGFNSINHFSHMHTTKAGLDILVNVLGLGQISARADTGRALVEQVNPVLAVATLLAALVAFAGLIGAARTVIGNWPRWQRTPALLIYAISGAHAVKCLLDGGPLAYDFLPAILSLYLLFRQEREAQLLLFLRRSWLRITLIFAIFLAGIALISPGSALLVQPLQYGYFLSGLVLLWLVLLAPALRVSLLIPAVAVASVVCGFHVYTQGVQDIVVLNRPVSSSDRVALLDWRSLSSVVDRTALGPAISHPEVAGLRLHQVYRACGENPLRNRNLLIVPEHSGEHHGLLFALRILKSAGPLVLESDQHLQFAGVRQTDGGNDSLYVFRVKLDPQLFSSLWHEDPSLVDQNNDFVCFYYLDHYFRAKGLTEYVLIPMYFEETA